MACLSTVPGDARKGPLAGRSTCHPVEFADLPVEDRAGMMRRNVLTRPALGPAVYRRFALGSLAAATITLATTAGSSPSFINAAMMSAKTSRCRAWTASDILEQGVHHALMVLDASQRR